ncbi:MAG TPA: GNAT family N-acetyltransferase [Acidimicrobiales bacterium]|nr:GNAT family N-acetyltransferase [Acidimicrobiales bacterium]
MPLRPASIDDLDEIIALIRELAEYEHAGGEVQLERDVLAAHLFGDSPAAAVVLAIDGGAVAGMALSYTTFSTWLGRPGIWLEDLFVRPEYRGRGHGSALLQHLRTSTDGRVEWAVLDWNTPSIEFYEALGARPVPGWTRYRWI